MPDLDTLDAELAAAEAQVPNLRQGCEKRVIWAGARGQKTKFAVLFIHGFSASPEEIRPLPDKVANALGANLHFTRLTGHGQDGDAMATASPQAWLDDVSEALQIAHLIGEKVIVIGCSTGCTLATIALARGAKVNAMVHVSPNFGLTHRLAQTILDLPASEKCSHLVVGRERSFNVLNEAHAAYWTVRYPTKAVHTMAATVREAMRADLGVIKTPALFCYNDADQVVSAKRTRKAIAKWGAATASYKFHQTPDDDQMGHIMAGDIFSPKQTDGAVAAILSWLEGLNM
ncbi:alpha/beta hydrolase [Yoonia litorea]|uniref:Esterase/lipase n=1 Tax=Yoonia litorea TaxID=1123755 RepID=A0A1I6MH91_9RHOB|nr:alpha/beta fold hydrolase [Yoonia litorea]SFS15013.1 Esterase/lipase [Yoonia litorea]